METIDEIKTEKEDSLGVYDYEPTKEELIFTINELVRKVNELSKIIKGGK